MTRNHCRQGIHQDAPGIELAHPAISQGRNGTGLSLHTTIFIAVITAVVMVLAPQAIAQELKPTEALAIAREAYGYGLPIVENYKTMYANAIDQTGDQYKAPFNVLKHEDGVITPAENSAETPNLDVLRSSLWMDLRAQPVVLEVPEIEAGRYYSIQLIDLYTFNFEYLGSRTTGNGAGRYVIAGPDWKGETPDRVDRIIRCETQFASAIYRTRLRGPEDVNNVQKIQSQFKVQTLSDFLKQIAPEAAATIEFPEPDLTTDPSLSFFTTLNFLFQFCPTDPSEIELIDRFARIGVGSKATVDIATISPEIQAALTQGIDEADAAISAAAATLKSAEIHGTREYLNNDFMKRAVAAKTGLYGNSKEESLRPLYLTDGEGNPLDASETRYVLKFAEADLPPVNAFWSITMYDSQNQALVANPISRYLVNSEMLSTLDRRPDGSVTLSIQHEAPGEEQTANWLPAPAGPFYLVMRLYWPRAVAYDGSWSPPLIWSETSAPQPSIPKPAGAEAAQEVKPSVIVEEPKPEMERPTVWGEPTEVQVAIYVIDVDEVNSADQSFAASVYYEARWKNPLLRHKGPGPKHRGISEVWSPRLTIIGQQMAWRSFPESVDIQPDGTVISRQKVWGRFSQPLMLRDFPFDEQTLSIQLVAAGLSEEHVKMVSLVNEAGRSSSIANKFSLPDFIVESWEALPTPYYPAEGQVGVAGYEISIDVHRQATYYILKVIIPLSLIVIMSWLPRWIHPKEIGTNIGISTSAFLTLVAYLFAITVLLPRVSYITRMDRFILLSTLTVFAGLIQSVFNTVMIRGQNGQRAERIDRWSRIVYPVLLVLILGYSFIS